MTIFISQVKKTHTVSDSMEELDDLIPLTEDQSDKAFQPLVLKRSGISMRPAERPKGVNELDMTINNALLDVDQGKGYQLMSRRQSRLMSDFGISKPNSKPKRVYKGNVMVTQ
jgi:hypothetical protein